MSNGLRDVLNYNAEYPYYFNEISTLRSQLWVLSFHFE